MDYGECKYCKRKYTGNEYCKACNVKHFQQNFKNWTSEFINEITMHCKTIMDGSISVFRVYGITQDPETKNYMMVLNYAENGSLRTYLDKNHYELTWYIKISYLWHITLGLKSIHEKELIHRDLHIGNLLHFSSDSSINGFTSITGMGLCEPADYNTSKNTKNSIYGVLPYIAPEVLREQNYPKVADIYKPKNSDDYYDEQNDNMIQNLYKSIFLNWQLKIMLQIKDYSTY
ncbi:kinase-like domain-containing protein [Rhizophagus irregularis DAOM 181602=DAOM 197198]|nr:kinase-like domain-containing protein [Rhizophagus irregularis DAOM 181602=DAOM 197198]